MLIEFGLGRPDSGIEIVVIKGRIEDIVASLFQETGLHSAGDTFPAVEKQDLHPGILSSFRTRGQGQSGSVKAAGGSCHAVWRAPGGQVMARGLLHSQTRRFQTITGHPEGHEGPHRIANPPSRVQLPAAALLAPGRRHFHDRTTMRTAPLSEQTDRLNGSEPGGQPSPIQTDFVCR